MFEYPNTEDNDLLSLEGLELQILGKQPNIKREIPYIYGASSIRSRRSIKLSYFGLFCSGEARSQPNSIAPQQYSQLSGLQ